MKNLLLLMFFSCTILLQKKTAAQTFREWTGTGTNWNTAGNWNPSGIAYAQLEWKGNGQATSNNDAGNPFNAWRLYFSGSKAYTLGGNPVSLFDFGGSESWVLSDATANQLINLNINFSDAGTRYSWITNRNTGTLTFGGNIAVTGANIIALRIAGTNGGLPAITLNGTLSGSKPVDIGKDNAGTDQVNTRVFFNGNNASYSGVTSLYAGTLSVPANSALGTGLLVLGNGTVTNTLAVTGTTSRSQNIQVNDGSTAGVIDVASGENFTLSGLLVQGGGTNNATKYGKAGAGTLTVSGSSTAYVGQIQIGNGTVIVQNNNGLGNNLTTSNRGIDLGLNVGDVSQANNVVLQATNGITVPQSIYVASNTSGATRTISLNGSGSATFNNEIYLDGDLTLSGGSGTITMSGNITPNSTAKGIIVTGGTVVISGNNTYTGNTTVNSGTLTLGSANRIANTSNVVLGGGTFSTGSGAGNNETVGTLNLTASTASTIALGTGIHTLTFANSSSLTPWGTGATLNITGWTGTGGPSGAGTAGKIIITGSGLTQAQLDKISFNGVLGATFNTSTGELVPKGIATASITNSPQTYTGSPIPAVISTNSGGAQSDVKYNGSGTVPTNAGTYAVTVDIAATANYFAGNDVAAGNFVIELSQATADFRSKSPGGNLSSASTWEYFNGTSWVNATQKPGSSNNVDILHSVTFDEAFTIGAGKTLTVGASGTANFNSQLVTVQSNSTGTGAIGKVTTGGSIIGATNVQVERFIPSSRQAWRLLGVPTTGSQTIRQAWMELGPTDAPNTNLGSGYGTIISAGSSIYVGNGSQNPGGFDAVSSSASIKTYNYTSGTAAFIFGNNVNKPIADTFTNGYFLFVRGNRSIAVNAAPATSATTLRSKGGINVGTVVKSLHYPGKYRLLANPYASTIDFNNVILSGGVTNGFYLWDASLGTTGGYSYFDDVDDDGTYTLTSGFGQYGANNSKIQSGQAFMVIAPSAAGTVTFTEDSKVSGSSNVGLRPAPGTTSRLHAVLSSGKQVYDGAAVLFAGKFSNNIDKNDAVKLYNPGENLGVVRNGKSFVVESRGAVTSEDEVQYEIKNLKQQEYTIEFRATNMTGEAWLVDNYLGTTTALNLNIATKVNFSVTAEAKSSAADRFKVVFRPAAVTTATGVPSIKVSPNPVEGGIMNVSFSQQAKGRYNLKLVDLSGRLLLNTVREHAGGSANQQLTLPSNLASGTYQLVITAPDRSSSVKKVLINNK